MHICDICEELIGRIIRPKVRSSSPDRGFINTEPINIGWLDSIIDNGKECNLCRLVSRIWDRVRLPEENNEQNRGWMFESGELKRVYVFLDNSTTTPLTNNGTRLNWIIGIDFVFPEPGFKTSQLVRTKYPPKFCLVADDATMVAYAQQEQPPLLGRLRDHTLHYDAGFLKESLKACLENHGEACSNPIRTANGRSFPLNGDINELPLGMRCIDLIGQNIVHLPRDPTCRYAVLSYVWGNSNFLRLTKANCAQLTAKEGLKHVQKPRTISDAMELTVALGIRYLWVDSLCIIQDYEPEKTRQIQKMDKIYASAMLTIVAAGANEANSGLWSLREGCRRAQVVEEVAGLRFIDVEPTFEDVLDASTWKKRAWTYQEYVLSKRLLTCSNNQVYFSCEMGAWAEDYVHTVLNNGRHELQCSSTEEAILSYIGILSNFPLYWSTLVAEYSEREITFETDALDAAAGVMANYGQGIQDSFVCGLPLSVLFEYSMLWYPFARVRRRSNLADGQAFPTWSWVGWVGLVGYEEAIEPLDFMSSRIIHKWSLRSSQKSLRYENGELSVLYNKQAIEVAQKIHQKADVDHHLSAIQSGELSFQTLCVKLEIAKTSTYQFVMSKDANCAETGLYRVFHRDKWIGSVHLEHQVAQDLLHEHECSQGCGHRCDHRCDHEFIALSINGEGPWYVPDRRDPHELDPDSDWVPLFDQAILEQHDTNNDDVYNAMLVRYERDTATATRLGIGQIHKRSFEEAGAVPKDIVLG